MIAEMTPLALIRSRAERLVFHRWAVHKIGFIVRREHRSHMRLLSSGANAAIALCIIKNR